MHRIDELYAVETWFIISVWYGLVRWVDMVWYGMVWYGMVWYGMVWYGMVWYGMVWYGMVDVSCSLFPIRYFVVVIPGNSCWCVHLFKQQLLRCVLEKNSIALYRSMINLSHPEDLQLLLLLRDKVRNARIIHFSIPKIRECNPK